MKINKLLTSVLFVLILIFILPFTINAQDSSEIIKRVSSDIDVVNNLFTEVENSTNEEEVLVLLKNGIPIVTTHLDESIAFYQNLENNSQDQKIKEIIQRIKASTINISSDLKSAEDSIYYDDAEGFEQSFLNYDMHIEELNQSVRDLESNSGIIDYMPILGWLFWISLIISAFLFIISRGNPILPAEKLRNQFEFALFKSSLWPFAGSAISYFWGLATPPGETYMVFWWPIGLGFFQFARGLYNYIKYARPAINLARIEQQNKLAALLVSEEFKESDMKEKLEEIEKLKPVHKINI